MAAYDYPLLSIFWSLLSFFALVIWFFAVAAVIVDVFRSHDLSGWAKAGWFVLVLLVPLLGLLAYLVVRGSKMGQRAFDAMDDHNAALDAATADLTGGSTADEIAKLADLRERGAITTDEFEKQKAVLLR
jgi:hypothetical protein